MKLSEDFPQAMGKDQTGRRRYLDTSNPGVRVMGGDFGPSVTVPAALQALNLIRNSLFF